jgi:hypothetical protein
MRIGNASAIQARIAKGWTPNMYLSNMSLAFFQQLPWGARELFPIVPVSLIASHYYKFNKGDLARLQVGDKPTFGKVDPAVMGITDDNYSCKVKQVIVGIDQIDALNYQRTNAPGVIDPRKSRSQFITEQMNLELDVKFAANYFKTGVWANELEGGTDFEYFNDTASDPIAVIEEAIDSVKKKARRKPNKIGLGNDVFKVLKHHPDIVERVKYTGSTANPASVTERVLAELFQVQKVVVMESTYNTAGDGLTESMDFICDPKGMLICYAPDSPQIDMPSAGYIFTWDMLGTGNWMAVDQFEGEGGTHSEYMEGLLAYDMKKVSDDCAVYLSDVVGDVEEGE